MVTNKPTTQKPYAQQRLAKVNNDKYDNNNIIMMKYLQGEYTIVKEQAHIGPLLVSLLPCIDYDTQLEGTK